MLVALVGALYSGCGAAAPAPATLKLDRVVLFQNGVGYFERHGEVTGSSVRMRLAPYEIDDVLKTVTVLDDNAASVAHVSVADAAPKDRDVPLLLRLSSSGAHRLHVSYAVPTPTWKASYRVVLEEPAARAASGGLLQGWATIHNTSGEDWSNVRLSLVTGAPFSYAMDLHSPTYVSRPDVNGVMVAPVTAPVEAEVARGGSGDSDGDTVKDQDDLCPKEPEDRDGFEDEDGCPDPDNDRDRIPDASDKCPNEPETYNGLEDEDGCPDRGRVVVTETNLEILDLLYFKKGSAALAAGQQPIVDAIAQTLLGNPGIPLLEIQGHAGEDEPRAWDLSLERSAAVATALRQKGVDARRLTTRGYGATQPLSRATSESGRAKNRRVGFLIVKRSDGDLRDEPRDGGAAPPAVAVTAANVARSARAQLSTAEVAGTGRYELAHRLTVPRGGATMVAIVNQPIDAEDVFLFRPDGAAPGSDAHPFRAIRLRNSTPLTLQAGALAVFARGTYVGDSLLAALAPDATAFAPYLVDRDVTVRVERVSDEVPVRVLSANKSAMTLEVARRYLTRYEVSPSTTAPARILLRHAKLPGYRVQGLPPGSIDQDDGWLVSVPLTSGKASSIVVEEQAPQRRTYDLTSDQLPDLTAYLAGSQLPDDAAKTLRAALAQRAALAKLGEELGDVQARYNDALDRATEARASLAALGQSPEGLALRKQMVAALAAATNEMATATRELAQKTREQVAAQAALRELVRTLLIAEPK